MINRLFQHARDRRARATRIEAGECALILNALEVLRLQRHVAVTTFGAADPHLAELDDERAGLLAQARELGAVWA